MTNETAYWEKQIAALHRTHEKQRRVGFIFLAMAVNLLLIFLAYLLGATYLATNDDTAIRSFASGSYSGEPSPYLVFVQYPLGFLLSRLYTWFPCVSWYGLFLLFSVWLSLDVLLYKLLLCCKKKQHYLLAGGLYLFFFVSVFLSCIKAPQFTTAAAMLSSAAALLPLTLQVDKKASHAVLNLILFGVLSFFAICIRRKIYLMVLPIVLIILVVRFIFQHKLFKRLLAFMWVAAFVYVGVLGIDLVMTNNDEYRIYAEYNHARSQVQDYYGFPSYEENKAFYRSIGVNELQYRMMVGGYFDVDPIINTDTLNAVSRYQNEMVKKEPLGERVIDAFTEAPGWFFKSYLPYATLAVLSLAVVSLLYAFLKGKRWMLLIGMTSLLAVFLEIVLLIFQGRMVLRLIESMVLLIGMLFLYLFVSLAANEGLFEKKSTKRKKNGAVGVLARLTGCITIITLVCITAAGNYMTHENIAKAKVRNSAAVFEMNDYCMAHPENFYFYSVSKFGGAIGYVLGDQETVFKNSSAVGGWSVKSPMYYEKLERFGIQNLTEGLINHRNVYYIDVKYPVYLRDYIRETYGEDLTLVRVDDIFDNQLFVFKVAKIVRPLQE